MRKKNRKQNNLHANFMHWISRKVDEGTKEVVAFQKLCGIKFITNKPKVTFEITNQLFFYLFTFGSGLGEELFYILFLPNFGWTINMGLAKKLILLWSLMYYVGQTLKDMFKLPRPSSPPVAHLENHYILEYGLPSTHAMAAVSVPFYIAYHLTPPLSVLKQSTTDDMVIAYVVLMWISAVIWSSLMTLSRLYFGVHSLYDIYAGVMIGVSMLLIWVIFGDDVDHYINTSPMAPIWVVVIGLVLVILFHVLTKPEKWTPCYGETVLILGVGVGVTLGCIYTYDLIQAESPPSLFFLSPASSYPPFQWISIFVVRSLMGYLILFAIRMIVKFASLNLLTKLIPIPQGTDIKRYYPIEIPTKLFTYTAVGFVAVFIPVIFAFFSLDLK